MIALKIYSLENKMGSQENKKMNADKQENDRK